jgi:hypothetical protein
MAEVSKVYKGVPFTNSLENYLGKDHVSLCQFLLFLNIEGIHFKSKGNIKNIRQD